MLSEVIACQTGKSVLDHTLLPSKIYKPRSRSPILDVVLQTSLAQRGESVRR